MYISNTANLEQHTPKCMNMPKHLSNLQNWEWILEGELHDVFYTLDTLHIEDDKRLQGEAMAFALKRLVASEDQVGGPYRSLNGNVEVTSNIIIDQFLRRNGIELPNLKPYRMIGQKELNNSDRKKAADYYYQAIQEEVQAQLAELPLPVRTRAKQMWHSVLRVDKNREMGQIATFFAQSLRDAKKPTKLQLHNLGVANFYVWMAYTIYDDFFDDEGQPAMLAVANITMRLSWDGYRQVWKNQKSRDLVDEVFVGMDAANAWEIARARAIIEDGFIKITSLPKYSFNKLLAERAMAHVLGPLLVTLNSGASQDQYRQVYKGLTQFLIARQLNDDIHDWRKDLQAGHLSPVVVYLLQAIGIRSGQYDLGKLVSKLEQYFWDQGLDEVCQIALGHIAKCRQDLGKSQLLDMDGPFRPLIDRLQDALTAGQAVHQNNRDFLSSYQSLQDAL